MKILFNPKKRQRIPNRTLDMPGGADIHDIWKGEKWDFPAGMIRKFSDQLADYFLAKYLFLQEVRPLDVPKKLEELKEKEFKCKLCSFETNHKIAFVNHTRSHRLTDEEEKLIAQVEEGKSSGEAEAVSPIADRQRRLTPEEIEGIPTGGTLRQPRMDRQGVAWYGKGLEDDRPDMRVIRRGQAGVF